MTHSAAATTEATTEFATAGDLVFCAGQIGIEPDGTVPADPERQFALALSALGQLLRSLGCTPADIVDLTSFHVGYPQHMREFMHAKDRFFGASRPAWTAIGVMALGYPGSIVELKAIVRRSNPERARVGAVGGAPPAP